VTVARQIAASSDARRPEIGVEHSLFAFPRGPGSGKASRTIMLRLIRARGLSAGAFAGALLCSSFALAEPAPAPPPPQPVPPAPAPSVPPGPPPAPVPVQAAPAEPTPAPAPVAPVSPAPLAPAAPAPSLDMLAPADTTAPQPLQQPEPALKGVGPDTESLPWYDAIEFRAFVDGYANANWNFPKPHTNASGVTDAPELANGVTRAYDTANGFALSWAGVDATYPAEPVGGTISLRFGPTAQRIAGSCLGGTCDSAVGLSFLKQAFASWKPWTAVSFDFGKFDTIYGAEVAESQDDMNYTRGVVYWFTQPLFHTGLRVNAQLTDELSLRGLVVNGWNNTIDNNLGKDVGLQLALNLPRSGDGGTLLATSLGYLGGPEQDDSLVVHCDPATQNFDPTVPSGCSLGNGSVKSGTVDRGSANIKGLRHLVDFVATLTPTDALTLQLNADVDIERARDTVDPTRFDQHSWWGVMLGARYSFVEQFAIAARGEYLSDPDAYGTGIAKAFATPDPTVPPVKDIKLVTGTLTLDYRPANYLILRLDNRLDWSNKQIFPKSVRDYTGAMPTTTLGVVVTTN